MENLSNKKNNWCVYMHENRINGKRYIGITSQKPTIGGVTDTDISVVRFFMPQF